MAAPIDPWVEENYDSIVNDPARHETYDIIAENAASMGDANLAAWARERAAKAGEDVTPTDAEPASKESRDSK